MDEKTKEPVEKSPLKHSQNGNQKIADMQLMATGTGVTLNSCEEPLSPQYTSVDCIYRHWAIGVAWASVFLLLVLAIASFILAAETGSSAMFGFGFDALLDVGTSIVVVWRFYGSRSTIYSSMREHVANIFLAFLFIAAAVSVASKAIIYLIEGTKLHTNPWLYAVTGFGLFVCVILAVIKFYVGYKLNSTAVISDGYSSLACGVTALGIIISAIVYENKPNIHFLDNAVALFVAVFLTFYGIKLFVITLMEPEMASAVKSCCKKIKEDSHELNDI
ncbi:transmembrane protein 163a-like [Amphiura filiformis]|uniref:transmembrane protein 163a-like n=1 Tax=Amphiura filiformis TaxID=82378 RepID=UPI003B21BF35